MPDVSNKPFDSFAFSLIQDKRPRCALRLVATQDGLYELHVEKGSAANPISQFTRVVPCESAIRLRDGLQAAGVFGWEESYGDDPARPLMRWNVSTVFKEGVFSVSSRGGNQVPAQFDALLEELYRLDFPRPEEKHAPSAAAAVPADVDFGDLSNLMRGSGLEGIDASQMAELLGQARTNPQALQQRMRLEFAQLPADEQERMLDALASSGMASRAWWERFLRG